MGLMVLSAAAAASQNCQITLHRDGLDGQDNYALLLAL